MNEKDILREAMLLSDTTQMELTKMCGYKSQSSIANIFSLQNSLRVDMMAKLLDVMGYDIVVRGREEVQAPGGGKYVPEWKVSCHGSKE